METPPYRQEEGLFDLVSPIVPPTETQLGPESSRVSVRVFWVDEKGRSRSATEVDRQAQG
jgi:hypothetical protein